MADNHEPLDELREAVAKFGRAVMGNVLVPHAPKGGISPEAKKEIDRLKKVVDQQLEVIGDKSRRIQELETQNRVFSNHIARLEKKDPANGDSKES